MELNNYPLILTVMMLAFFTMIFVWFVLGIV